MATMNRMSSSVTADPAVIAVFNASEDTVDLLVEFFQQRGFQAVGRTWKATDPLNEEVALGFFAQHKPRVVVFDVSLPYESNWARFCEFRQASEESRVPIVLTTTNAQALTDCVGPTAALEIVGKPYDLDQLLAAVRRALVNA